MSNQYSLCWKHGDLKILHPRRGLLPVQNQKGCPQLPRALALDLIEETIRSLKFEKEQKWMQELIQSHPVLRELPKRIKDRQSIAAKENVFSGMAVWCIFMLEKMMGSLCPEL